MTTPKKKKLENPPLKEAMFEIKWQNSKIDPKARKDTQLLAGVLWGNIKDEYKFHEPLDAANFPMPDDFEGIVQHRFRVAENSWPLVQIGPGVLTLNDTEKYDWASFKARSLDLLDQSKELIPEIEDVLQSLSLRYVNAFPVDLSKEKIFEFAQQTMGLGMMIPTDLLAETKLEVSPSNFISKYVFRSEDTPGGLSVSIATGRDAEKGDVLILELDFRSIQADLPELSQIEDWLEKCHEKIEVLFFNLAENVIE